ncbi:MAG: hypothetical protein ACRC6M_17400, partial [Microcystaceae cyanobacterium]
MIPPVVTSSSYQTQSQDTAIAAELALFNLWRSWNPLQRITQLNHNTKSGRLTAWHIAKTTLVNQNKEQQIRYFLKKVLDHHLLNDLDLSGAIEMTGAIEEALIVSEILDSLGIAYLVGGSVASGIWGEMRYTQDIDLVVDLKDYHIENLIKAFSPRFYLSESAIKEAIKLGQSFNLIDNQTGWKIDIFILTQDPFQQTRFRQQQQVSVNDMGQTLNFSSPEDTILQKLIWSRMTQPPSAQQWRDILGVLKLQQSALDFTYLQQWATTLQLSAELEQA